MGHDARYDQEEMADNPFEDGDKRSSFWIDGWWAADEEIGQQPKGE
jgi:hypothetical protein